MKTVCLSTAELIWGQQSSETKCLVRANGRFIFGFNPKWIGSVSLTLLLGTWLVIGRSGANYGSRVVETQSSRDPIQLGFVTYQAEKPGWIVALGTGIRHPRIKPVTFNDIIPLMHSREAGWVGSLLSNGSDGRSGSGVSGALQRPLNCCERVSAPVIKK